MESSNDNKKRIRVLQNDKSSGPERHQKDIIKSLKKAGLNQNDINYIINGLNEIDQMIQDKKNSQTKKIDL